MHGNWIRATSTTTGTGSLTLSAASGYPAPSSQFAQGERFSYALVADADGKPIEGGIGYLDGSGALVRECPTATYNSGTLTYTDATSNAGLSPISLTGTTRVICTPLKTADLAATRRGRPSGTQANDIFHPANFVNPITGSLALGSSGRSYYVPILVDFAFPVDAFVTYLGSTGGSIDIGLYGVLPTGDPGDLLIGWSNKTATANVLNAYTLASADAGRWAAAARIIPPGWYWLCLNGSASISFSRIFSLHQQSLLPMHDTGERKTCLFVNRTQGTLAQPAPSGMSATTISGSSDVVSVPMFGFRRAA